MSPLGLQTCVTFHFPHLNSVTLPPGVYRPETRETHPQVLLILPSKYMSNLSPALHCHCPLAWTLQYLLQQIVAVQGHPASSHCIFCSRSWFSSGRCANNVIRSFLPSTFHFCFFCRYRLVGIVRNYAEMPGHSSLSLRELKTQLQSLAVDML